MCPASTSTASPQLHHLNAPPQLHHLNCTTSTHHHRSMVNDCIIMRTNQRPSAHASGQHACISRCDGRARSAPPSTSTGAACQHRCPAACRAAACVLLPATDTDTKPTAPAAAPCSIVFCVWTLARASLVCVHSAMSAVSRSNNSSFNHSDCGEFCTYCADLADWHNLR